MTTIHLIPSDISDLYEVHEWRNAAGVLFTAHLGEWNEIMAALRKFRFATADVLAPGKNKSELAKGFDATLLSFGWRETQFRTAIRVDNEEWESPTHKVDCYKNRVALEVEWNNKDPFFDRDLNNFRLLFDLRVIDVGIIVTRCSELQTSNNFIRFAGARKFRTILADPPWQFQNKTGKVAPEHRRLSRYGTMRLEDIKALPVADVTEETAHLYMWVPNALLPEGLEVLRAWGFAYKSNIVWHKIRKDGGSDGRGVGFYFRNVTELILFGVKGKNARTLDAGRTQVNYLATRKREHSRKPDEQYDIIESCSPGPYLELFARGERNGWAMWGDQADDSYHPNWPTYANHSRASRTSRLPPAAE